MYKISAIYRALGKFLQCSCAITPLGRRALRSRTRSGKLIAGISMRREPITSSSRRNAPLIVRRLILNEARLI